MFDEDRISKDIKDEIHKDRIYIDDPSEAPEWANVQEGSRGGYFYDDTPAQAAESLGVDINEMEDSLADIASALQAYDGDAPTGYAYTGEGDMEGSGLQEAFEGLTDLGITEQEAVDLVRAGVGEEAAEMAEDYFDVEESDAEGPSGGDGRVNEFEETLSQFGNVEEVNPGVHVAELGDSLNDVEMVLHEDTDGAMGLYYEGEFGEEADLEANFDDLSMEDGNLVIEDVEGHIADEGMPSNHFRNVTVTITPEGEFEVDQDVL